MRAASGGVPAKSGWAAQRSANCLDRRGRRRRRRGARRRRRAPRARRLVLDARGRRDEHQALDALGRRERDVLRDPAAHRVAARATKRAGARGQHVGHAGVEADGRAARAPPWPRRSGASGRIAFAIQPLRPPDPRRAPSRRSRAGGRRWWASAAHLDRDDRHLPAAARLRRRAGALRPGRRVHLAGLALDAARARARAPAGPADAGRTSTSASPASSRSGVAKQSGRPGGAWRARAAPRPRTTCPP